MMNFENYHFFGMYYLWWIIWIILLFWIFATPYNIPGQRTKKDTPLNMLKKRLVLGEINKEEYEEMKKLIDS